jgi:hypothetical protein
VRDAPTVMGEHDDDEEDAQAGSGDGEEIDGHEVREVIGQERTRRLRWR